ncbi:hypothetical protein MSPP1_002481 [Malassezia sp. CBS 17886]|nr:hypothetical protein MSPP1_002481 [Malassezia sp. CBS 17886]
MRSGALAYTDYPLQRYSRRTVDAMRACDREETRGGDGRHGAARGDGWEHVSLQPLWCRVETVTCGCRGETLRMYATVEVEGGPLCSTDQHGIRDTPAAAHAATCRHHTQQSGAPPAPTLRLESLDFAAYAWSGGAARAARGGCTDVSPSSFELQATYHGDRIAFRRRAHGGGPSRRFQLQFLSDADACAFREQIEPWLRTAAPISYPQQG